MTKNMKYSFQTSIQVKINDTNENENILIKNINIFLIFN
jgi:hypothetical protein